MPRSERPNLLVFDESSGEQVKYTPAPEKRGAGQQRPKQKTGGFWVRFYPDEAWRLMGLNGSDFRVLLHLTQETVPDKPFRYSNTDIAKKLGITPAAVSRSTRNLQAQGILIKTEGERTWHLNPLLFWRGADPSREDTIERLDLTVQNSGHQPEEEP